jgi:hypothetical protein
MEGFANPQAFAIRTSNRGYTLASRARKEQRGTMSTDLHSLTDELEHLTSELRTLVSQSQNLAIERKRLVELSVSLQREYADQVGRTFTPMLTKHSAPARPRLQG